VWFKEAEKLKIGQAIFIRVANKKEQISLANDLEFEREQLAQINTILASQIFITKTIKDFKQYVVLERKDRTPFTAFFKDADGNFSKLSVDPERSRIIRLMLRDKKEITEIEETLNGLTEEEVEEFFPYIKIAK
jgi:hypothetical protein